MNYLNQDSKQDDSQLHLDAMLYVLEDPSLDRDAFEAKLLEDDRLCEILAEAVQLFHSMRQSDIDRVAPVYLELPQVRTYAEDPSRNLGDETRATNWLGLAALAASILVVGFLGWKSMRILSTSTNMNGDEFAYSSQNAPRGVTGAESSLKQVVWAWREVGTGHHEELSTHYVSSIENEVALAASDSVCESDVPEWLVMATKAIVQQDDGVDLPFENIDSRTLIQ